MRMYDYKRNYYQAHDRRKRNRIDSNDNEEQAE